MVVVKAATSLDGRIAAAPGRSHGHHVGRGQSPDAAAARGSRRRGRGLRHGAGRRSGADGPRLLPPEAPGASGIRPPAADAAVGPAVLDARGRAGHNNHDRRDDCPASRARRCARGGRAPASWKAPASFGADVRALLAWDISTLLLEGGGVVHAAAWQAGIVDRVIVIVAPTVLGEQGAKVFDGLPVPLSRLMPVRVETSRTGRVDGGRCSRGSLKAWARWRK